MANPYTNWSKNNDNKKSPPPPVATTPDGIKLPAKTLSKERALWPVHMPDLQLGMCSCFLCDQPTEEAKNAIIIAAWKSKPFCKDFLDVGLQAMGDLSLSDNGIPFAQPINNNGGINNNLHNDGLPEPPIDVPAFASIPAGNSIDNNNTSGNGHDDGTEMVQQIFAFNNPEPPAGPPPAAVAAAPANNSTKNNSNLVTPERQNKRKAEAIALSCYRSNVAPVGPYCMGSAGADSVFNPLLCGTNLTRKEQDFVDAMKKMAGTLILHKAVNNFHNSHLPNPKGADFGEALARSDLEMAGIDMENVKTAITQFLSPIVSSHLLKPIQQMGVCNIDNMGDCLGHGGTGRMIATNTKSSFLFVPVMIRDKKFSLFNKENMKEFSLDSRGSAIYNRDFWNAQKEIKRTKSGGAPFTTMDIGFFQPLWTIPEEQLDNHLDALKFMKDNGPVVFNSNNICLMNLKNEYAHVFLTTMRSRLVAKARLQGYHPLWLIKNCLLQSSNYGINGCQFSSMDKHPKTWLSLVGFCKGNPQDNNFSLVTLTNAKDELLSIDPSSA